MGVHLSNDLNTWIRCAELGHRSIDRSGNDSFSGLARGNGPIIAGCVIGRRLVGRTIGLRLSRDPCEQRRRRIVGIAVGTHGPIAGVAIGVVVRAILAGRGTGTFGDTIASVRRTVGWKFGVDEAASTV